MRRLLACVVAVALFVSTAQAQSGDWAAVEGLSYGTDIFVKAKSGKKYQGDFESANPERIVIWSHERAFPGRKTVRREITREDVKEVRLNRRGVSALTGAAIGAGVGAGLGVAADAPSKDHEYRGLVAVVFALLGGAIGAGIGKTHPFVKGKLIYVAP